MRPGLNLCVDTSNGGGVAGQNVQQATCSSGSAAQKFVLDSKPGGMQVHLQGKTLCLEVTGNSSTPGTLLRLATCNGSDAQVFAPLVSQMLVQNSGACLDTPGSSTTPGLQLQTYACNDSGAQTWEIKGVSGPINQIARNGTSLCVGVPSIALNQPVQQVTCNSASPNQLWIAEVFANGSRLKLNNTNLCLETSTGNTTLANCSTTTDSQLFSLTAPQLRKLSSGSLPGLCVDAPFSSVNPGDGLWAWTCNQSNAQNWSMTHISPTLFQIGRGGVNLCVAAASASAGAAIQQATCNASSLQQWLPETVTGGTQVRLNNSSLCLAMPEPNNSDAVGTYLTLATCNGSAAQVWGE